MMVFGTSFAADKDFAEKLVKPGVLTVGTSGSAAPFTYYNEDDELVGYDIDVANKIAEDLGLEVEFVALEWSGLLPGLIAKRFDVVMSGVTRSEERLASDDMILTQPYTVNGVCLMKKKGDDRINGWDDIKGMVMGGIRGSVQASLALEQLPEGTVTEEKWYPSWTEMLLDLETGRMDFAAMDCLGPTYLMKSGDYNVEVQTDPIVLITQGIAVNPNNPELAEKIDNLIGEYKESGELEELIRKNFLTFLPWSLLDE